MTSAFPAGHIARIATEQNLYGHDRDPFPRKPRRGEKRSHSRIRTAGASALRSLADRVEPAASAR